MAIRNKPDNDIVRSVKEKTPQTFTDVMSVFPAKVIAIGEVTKSKYIWSKAGVSLSVDTRDVPALLRKKVGNGSCCGGGRGNVMFQVKE